MFGYQETREILDSSSSSSNSSSSSDEFTDHRLIEKFVTHDSIDKLDQLIALIYQKLPLGNIGKLDEALNTIIEEMAFHYCVKCLWRESLVMRDIENNIGTVKHETTGSIMAAFFHAGNGKLKPLIKRWLLDRGLPQ